MALSKLLTNLKLRRGDSRLITVVVVIVIVIMAGLATYYFLQYRDLKTNLQQATQDNNHQESSQVLADVKRVILIDEADEPTIAKVQRADTLRKNNPDFYKNVSDGDYLILYKKRAIIYRQSNSQIINIAPIVDSQQKQ